MVMSAVLGPCISAFMTYPSPWSAKSIRGALTGSAANDLGTKKVLSHSDLKSSKMRSMSLIMAAGFTQSGPHSSLGTLPSFRSFLLIISFTSTFEEIVGLGVLIMLALLYNGCAGGIAQSGGLASTSIEGACARH